MFEKIKYKDVEIKSSFSPRCFGLNFDDDIVKDMIVFAFIGLLLFVFAILGASLIGHFPNHDYVIKGVFKVICILAYLLVVFHLFCVSAEKKVEWLESPLFNSNKIITYIKRFKKDKAIISLYLKSGRCYSDDILPIIGNDIELGLVAVSVRGADLQYVADELKDNKEIVLKAVENDGNALQFASDRLKQDRDVVLSAVKQNGCALEYMCDDLKDDKEVVLCAVKQNGYALEYASDVFKKDKDIVLVAIKQTGNALQFVSVELKNDNEVVLSALKQNGYALRYACDDLKDDKEIVLTAINNNPYALNFASNRIKNMVGDQDAETFLENCINNEKLGKKILDKFNGVEDVKPKRKNKI